MVWCHLFRVNNSKDQIYVQGPRFDMKKMNIRNLHLLCKTSKQNHRLFAMMLVIVMLSACAAAPSAENDLKNRAQARWDALLARDYATAYSFYTPGYRSSTTVVDFEIAQRVRRVVWTGAKVEEASCSGDVCTLDTVTSYQVVRPVPGMTKWDSDSVTPEKWIRTDGQWWYVPVH
jgi:hypothetical protein